MSVPIDQMEAEFTGDVEETYMAGDEQDEDLSAGTGPEPLDESQLSSIIEEELTNALGGDVDSELSENWTQAMNYFLGRKRGDEKPGRSSLISMDLADTVEQTVAQMMPAFEDTSLAEFEPLSKEDEEQAQQESDALNYLVMRKNNGWVNIQSGIKDGMLQRIGIMKVYVDECPVVTSSRMNSVSQFDLPQLMEQADQGQNEIEVTAAEMVQDAAYDELGQMIQAAMFNIEYKEVRRNRKLKVEAVPPDEIRINADHGTPFLNETRFLSHSRPVKRSELVNRGYDYDTVMGLPTHTSDTDQDQRARDRDSNESEYRSAEKLTESVMLDEIYMEIDYDGDGVAERRRIIHCEGEVFENDYFPIVPFAGGMPFLMPHKPHGISFFDKLKQVQDGKTNFIRKTEDNAETLINQRKIAVVNQVNMDDLLTSRPGGVIRVKDMNSMSTEPATPLGQTGFQMLQYYDKIRRESAGSALDLGTSENIPVKQAGAHGVERWMTSQEQLTASITRLFGETMVRGIFLISHWMVRNYLPDVLTFRRNKNWIETNPQEWQEREDVSINLLTNGERAKRYQALEGVIQKQTLALQNGQEGTFVTMSGVHKAVIDQCRVAGLPAPEQYFVDPDSDEAKQAQEQKTQNAQQAQQKQDEMAQQIQQLTLGIQQMQEETKRMKAQSDAAIDANEQLRKWWETEIKYNKDFPGQGGGE